MKIGVGKKYISTGGRVWHCLGYYETKYVAACGTDLNFFDEDGRLWGDLSSAFLVTEYEDPAKIARFEFVCVEPNGPYTYCHKADHATGDWVGYTDHIEVVEKLKADHAAEVEKLREERDAARELVKAFVSLEVYGDVAAHQEDCRESVNKWESEK